MVGRRTTLIPTLFESPSAMASMRLLYLSEQFEYWFYSTKTILLLSIVAELSISYCRMRQLFMIMWS